MEKGDYIYDPNTGVSFILKESKEVSTHGRRLCSSFCSIVDGNISTSTKLVLTPPFNVNNPEIIDELDKALFKEGYYFDTDKLEISEKRWMPENDRYYIPFYSQIDCTILMDYEHGLCCKTLAEADMLESVAYDAIRKYLTNKK